MAKKESTIVHITNWVASRSECFSGNLSNRYFKTVIATISFMNSTIMVCVSRCKAV